MTRHLTLAPLTLRQAREILVAHGVSAPFGSRLAIGAAGRADGTPEGVLIAGSAPADWLGERPVLGVQRLNTGSAAAAVLLSLAIRRASASLGYKMLVFDVPTDWTEMQTVLRETGWHATDEPRYGYPAEGTQRWITSSRYFDHTPATVCLGRRRFWQRCNTQ